MIVPDLPPARSGASLGRKSALASISLALLALGVACSRADDPVSGGVVRAPEPGSAIRLDGAWGFEPGSGAPEPGAPLGGRLEVPGVWDEDWPGLRTGTYRLRVTGLRPGALYALQFKGVSSSCVAEADGLAIGAWGEAGELASPITPRTFYFAARAEAAELSVAVESSAYAWGGLWCPVWFGESASVERSAAVGRFLDSAILGSIAMMALYHLALYAMRRDSRAALYFSAVCVATALKVGLSEEQVLALLVPALDGALGLRLAYLATIAVPPLFVAYLHAAFPGSRRLPVVAGLLAVGAVEAVLCVAAPLSALQVWFAPYFIAIGIAGAYALYFLIGRLRERALGAAPILVGVLVLLVSAVNDMLYDQKIISSFYSIGLGLFVFLFDQAIVLGGLFARSFKEARDLNANLESRVAERTSELERLSRMDPLTGLVNRRYFWEKLEGEWARWTRYDQDFCLALLDIDHFKELNDSLGHAAGDEALKRLGALLLSSVRRTDVAARYGGEEFCLILPGTGLEEAGRLLEKIRLAMEASPLVAGPPPLSKTLSYGVALASSHGSPAELIDAADKLMYRAKEAGRNRGCLERATVGQVEGR